MSNYLKKKKYQEKLNEWRRHIGIPEEEEAIGQQLARWDLDRHSDRINHMTMAMMMTMMMTEKINCCFECSRFFRTAAILKSSRLAGTFGLKLKVSCTFLRNLSV